MRVVQALMLLAMLGVAIAFPQFDSNGLHTTIATFTLMYALMATSWNILAGYTGYVSLGHAAFFGIGAYALGIMTQHWPLQDYQVFLLFPLVGLICAACAVPLGIITLRTRRHVFVVLTIAMLFIGQLLATNLTGLTGGSAGMGLPTPSWTGAFFNVPFYYAALILVLAALATSWWVRHSKFGLGLLAIRDDEDRALGLGVRTDASKLVAFVIPAFFIGMAGALYGYFDAYIYPQFVFNPLDDLAMALMSFAGGLGTLVGPMLGALIIEPLHEYFAFQNPGGLYLVYYGAVFLVVILFMPQGIWPALRSLWSHVVAGSRGGRPWGGYSGPPIEEAPVMQHEQVGR